MARKAGPVWNTVLFAYEQELGALPGALAAAADHIMAQAAEQARAAIVGAYPEQSGRLRKGVRIRATRKKNVSGVTLKQTAPHGWMYEHGTVERKTRMGWPRGRMKPTPTFRPIADRYQQQALEDITTWLKATGAQSVTGSPDIPI